MRNIMLKTITVGLLCAGSAQAASVFYDFNSNPSGVLTLYGNATWNSTGGPGTATNANDGWLEVTPAANGQRSVVVFDDFDSGQVVNAFTFEADFRIGNGNPGLNPADGFSVSYCRAGDNILTDIGNGGDPSADGDIFNYGPNCENNLPEEGLRTGIAVGFDAWDSGGNAPYCDGNGVSAPGNIGPDIVGIDVHVDAALIEQFAMPTLNGTATDPTSIQTGPLDPVNPLDPNSLGWAHLKVQLDAPSPGTHTLTIVWKGTTLLDHQAVTYFPTPGRLVFAGRTGNANENQDVDNISIVTVPAALALVGGASGYADGFNVTIGDSGASVVDTTTVTVQLDGSPITPTSVNKVGGTTTIIYHGFPTLLASGSAHSVFVDSHDTHGNDISGTRPFNVPTYATIPAADAVAGVTPTKGFRLQPWQTDQGDPNTVYWMLEQLNGLRGANNADLTTATDNGYIDYTGVINFDAKGGPDGNFIVDNGYPDLPFPGIPGANTITDNTSMNMRTFLNFVNPGIYTLGVNSDDGFVVSEGKNINPDDWFSQPLGLFNGGRGASDTTFIVAVPAAGTYPIRLAWENGGGGANCEFFSIQNGVKYLINDPDPTNTTGIAAYNYSGAPSLPAFVSGIQPNPNSGNNLPSRVFAQLTDEGTTVTLGSIVLYVDGTVTAPVNNHTGTKTTVTLTLDNAHLLSPGAHNAALVWSDSSSNNHSNYWTFSVAPYATLPVGLATAPGSGHDSGFRLKGFQSPNTNIFNGYANNSRMANEAVNGLYGANVADTSNYTNNGYMWLPSGVINFGTDNQGAAVDVGNFQTSNGHPDSQFPGLAVWVPPTTPPNPEDNVAMEFLSYIEFPAAGPYVMGVNSDDGFRVTVGGHTRPGNSMFKVIAPASIAGEHVGMNTTQTDHDGNRGFGGPLPNPPIVAQAVITVPLDASAPLANAAAVAGKIAVTQRGGANFATQSLNCFNAGAIAVVGSLAPGDAGQLPGTRGGSATTVTIPCVQITYEEGLVLQANATTDSTSQLRLQLNNEDCNLDLGDYDGGRGSSDTLFAVVAPAAGVWPIRLVWENAGGGCNCEFFTMDPATGVKTLINDPTNPVKAWINRTAAPPAISVSNSGGSTTVTFGGFLQSADDVTDPYTDVITSSPYVVPAGGSSKFYRSYMP